MKKYIVWFCSLCCVVFFCCRETPVYPQSNEWLKITYPSCNYVAKMEFINTRLIAATDNGIFISTDYGVYWTPSNNGFGKTPKLSAMFVSGNDVYVADDSGAVFHSGNAGTDWKLLNNTLHKNGISKIAVSNGTLLAATSSSLYALTAGDTAWVQKVVEPLDPYVRTLAASPKYVFMGNGMYTNYESWGGCYVSSDSARTWKKIFSSTINCITPVGDSIFVGTLEGGLYSLSFNGSEWKSTYYPIDNSSVIPIYTVVVRNKIICAINEGGIAISTDAGKTWRKETIGSQNLKPSQIALIDNILLAITGDRQLWRRII